MTKNVHVLDWIKEMADMTQPDRIVWIDGSEEQTEALRKEAVSTGELIKLNPEASAELLSSQNCRKRRCPC